MRTEDAHLLLNKRWHCVPFHKDVLCKFMIIRTNALAAVLTRWDQMSLKIRSTEVKIDRVGNKHDVAITHTGREAQGIRRGIRCQMDRIQTQSDAARFKWQPFKVKTLYRGLPLSPLGLNLLSIPKISLPPQNTCGFHLTAASPSGRTKKCQQPPPLIRKLSASVNPETGYPQR